MIPLPPFLPASFFFFVFVSPRPALVGRRG